MPDISVSRYYQALDEHKKRKAAEAIHKIYELATPGGYFKAHELWSFAGYDLPNVPPSYLRDVICYGLPKLGWRRVKLNTNNLYYHFPLDANRVEATDWQRLPAPHRP